MYSRWGFFSGSVVKNPPAIQETQVQSLDGEDPLEKEMATHSSILAWRILWTVKPGGLQSMGSQRVGYNRLQSMGSQRVGYNRVTEHAYTHVQ